MPQLTPQNPPKWALRLFRWFCHEDYVEDLEGDLLERFEKRQSSKGSTKAKWLFLLDVARLFKPGLIKNLEGYQKLNGYDMFKNNLLVAKRQILRNKVYSFIKIGGFSLGISICLLIALFIHAELSFDKHHPDGERLYRLVKRLKADGRFLEVSWFAAPFANAMVEDYPQIELAGRKLSGQGFGAGTNYIRPADQQKNFFRSNFIFLDQQTYDIFQFPLIHGNPSEVLKEPYTIVLSKSESDILFPGENPVGKSVFLNDNTEQPLKVTGVMEDLPSNTIFDFKYALSLQGREFWPGEQTFWGAQNYEIFVKLHPDTSPEILEKELKGIAEKYIAPYRRSLGQVSTEEYMENLSFNLEPVSDIHLYSSDVYDTYRKSDIRMIWAFGAIAVFILILACINFINLSTAKSSTRAKEVGLRKTIGSQRGVLIWQFLTESVVFSLLSFLLAIGCTYLLLPFFNQVAEKNLTLLWDQWEFSALLFFGAILIGLISGIYPALYLSSFKPATILKGNLKLGRKSAGLRNVLVVFQFAASTALIVGTVIVYNQMDYILKKDLGFDKEQTLLLRGTHTIPSLPALREELLKIPEVSAASVSDYLPVTGTVRNGNSFWKDGTTRTEKSISGQFWRIDEHYISTLGMEIVEGRNLSSDFASDSSAILVNQAMVKALGIIEPIGKKITNRMSNRPTATFTIVGVVKDFHHNTMIEEIGPLSMILGNSPSITTLRLQTDNLSSTLSSIADIWEEFAPNQPLIYEFMDQLFGDMHAGILQMQKIMTGFAILAIVIACLGLFGLSVFMVEQRSKEISIRLVLGASIRQIVGMLNGSFLKPILISFVIAVPAAWYGMKAWLNDFAYQTELGIGLFLVAMGIALVIALLTISYQSIGAALSSPVKGLRNE